MSDSRCCINRIILHAFFSDLLLFFNFMVVRFIHEVGWSLSLLILIATWYPTECMYLNVCIYRKCSQLGVITQDAASGTFLTGTAAAAVFSSWSWSWLLGAVLRCRARIDHMRCKCCTNDHHFYSCSEKQKLGEGLVSQTFSIGEGRFEQSLRKTNIFG